MTPDDEQWLEQFLQTTPRRRQAILYKALHATGLRIGASLDKEIERLSRAAAETAVSEERAPAEKPTVADAWAALDRVRRRHEAQGIVIKRPSCRYCGEQRDWSMANDHMEAHYRRGEIPAESLRTMSCHCVVDDCGWMLQPCKTHEDVVGMMRRIQERKRLDTIAAADEVIASCDRMLGIAGQTDD